ncbi:unnamed protein product [Acidocella sp. C78]|nr:unnamed protein product [Acidocella sp. C78]
MRRAAETRKAAGGMRRPSGGLPAQSCYCRSCDCQSCDYQSLYWQARHSS